MADLITRGCERRSNLLRNRQTLTLQRYRELGILRDEFMSSAGWNQYDLKMKLRPKNGYEEDGKTKKERKFNDPFIKGEIC